MIDSNCSKNMIILKALLLLSVAILFYACKADPPTVESPRPVVVVVVESLEEGDSKSFSGIVQERDLVKLSFRVAGQVEEIPFEEGRFVRKEELLARLDDRDYRLRLDAVRAEHEQVTTEIRRYKELYARKNITENEYEKALAGEKQINAKLRAAENALADTRLRAPFDGFVQNLYVSRKEMVDAGTLILSLVDLSALVIETGIPPAFFLLRDRFDEFTFSTPHYPGKTFPLELIGISAKADRGNLYRTRLQYRPESDYPLAPGMSVRVTIHYRRDSQVLARIPVTAIVSRGAEPFVWRVQDGTVRKAPVETGMIDRDGTVEIMAGLDPGDVIVAAGAMSLVEGQTVRTTQ